MALGIMRLIEVDSRLRGNDGLCPRSSYPRKRVAGNLKKSISVR